MQIFVLFFFLASLGASATSADPNKSFHDLGISLTQTLGKGLQPGVLFFPEDCRIILANSGRNEGRTQILSMRLNDRGVFDTLSVYKDTSDVTVSSSGRYLAIATVKGPFYIYDRWDEKYYIGPREQLLPVDSLVGKPPLMGTYFAVNSLRFSQDEKQLLTVRSNGDFEVYNLSNWRQHHLTQKSTHPEIRNAVGGDIDFSGRYLVTFDSQGQGELIDRNNNALIHSFTGRSTDEGSFPSVISSTYGPHFMTHQPIRAEKKSQMVVQVWHVLGNHRAPMELLSQQYPVDFNAPVIFADKKSLLSGNSNGSIEQIGLPDAEVIRSYRDGHQKSPITAIALSPDKSTFASGAADGSVCLWSLQKEAPLLVRLNGNSQPIYRISFSREGNYLLVSTANPDAETMEAAKSVVYLFKVDHVVSEFAE